MDYLTKDQYQKLLDDLAKLYTDAKKAVVGIYWQMGKRIVEAEQHGAVRAPYGAQLIKQISKDLTRRVGQGFSKSNLERMRRFFLENPIAPTSVQLTWSTHVELLSVKDAKKRRLLQQKITRKKFSARQIRNLIQNQKDHLKPSTPFLIDLKQPVAKLKYAKGVLGTFSVASSAVRVAPKDEMILDLGFHVFLTLSKDQAKKYTLTDKPHYTYAARVERVVDGDTFLAQIDCGFHMFVRERLRLRGIDCPELKTSHGEKAKEFVAHRLPQGSIVVIKTHKGDKYGRYVSDVFYLEGEEDPEKILRDGIFLNQELLNEHLAVRV